MSNPEPARVTAGGEWRTFPPIDLPSPVLALLAGAGRIWAGGLGGVARFASAEGWTPLPVSLPPRSVTALAEAAGSLLAGGHGTIARSLDGGGAWQQCSVPEGAGTVTALAPSPRCDEDGTVLAATLESGVLRSTDAGQSWQSAGFGLQSPEVLAITWESDQNAIAATAAGLFRSSNAGRSWRVLPPTAGRAFVALAATVDGEMLAAPAAGPPLWSSSDLETWSPVAGIPGEVEGSALLAFGAGRALLGTAGHGLWLSTDNGGVWSSVSLGNVFSLAADGTRVYAGTGDGVMASDDGGETWTALPTAPMHDLHRLLLADGAPLVVGLHSPPVISHGGGWTVLADTPVPSTGVFVGPDDALFAATPDGLYRSADRGATWDLIVAGTAGGVTQMAFAGDGRRWAGITPDGTLLRSVDGGRTWEHFPAPFGVLPLIALQAVPGSASGQSVSLIAATYDERRRTVAIWRSDDGGESWRRGADSPTAWPVVATCGTPPLVAIGGTTAVRRPDGEWRRGTVGETGVWRVAGNGAVVVALAGDGLWCSDDLGLTWSRDDTGLPLDEIMDVAVDGNDLLVLLTGGRLWSRPL